MEIFSYPNQERAEEAKTSILRTDVHPNKLTALTFAEAWRRAGFSCRVYERPVKADNRVLLLAVTVTREKQVRP